MMKIITVIPLTRSKVADELSYFTGADVPVGAIVTVPIRSKSVHAIVKSVTEASNLKADIKKASFAIRKLNKMKATAFFTPDFISACGSIAQYYATNMGAVIDALVSHTLLEEAAKIAAPLPKQPALSMTNAAKIGQPKARLDIERVYAIQGDDADRISSWRSLIRQEFARKKSIAMYVPTVEDAETMYKELEKGIEGYIYTLHGTKSKKEILDTWRTIADIDHPVMIIATGIFSILPRADIETVIIERENGRGWVGAKAPYLDLRYTLETIARHRKQAFFIADSMLRAETLLRVDNDEIDQGSPFKWRSISNAYDELIDMKSFKATVNKFRILSPQVEKLIRANKDESTHLFMYTLRRGLASSVVCDDCETVVVCNNCSKPVTLHTSAISGQNFFMCHVCGERRSADENCKNCGGWRLTPLGIGIDRVREELRAKFPDVDVFQIDADTTKTPKQIRDVIDAFRARPGSILLGTELALLHLDDKIEHIAITSMDSLFGLPDFRISERIVYTLIRLRSQATRTFLVQTRRPEEKVFEFGLKGNLSDFYRMTLDERKQFRYPPFAVLVKITIEGKKEKIAAAMQAAQDALTPFEVVVFPAFTATVRGNSVIHGLITIEPHAWPDPEIISRLRALPPNVSIKVNPETLL